MDPVIFGPNITQVQISSDTGPVLPHLSTIVVVDKEQTLCLWTPKYEQSAKPIVSHQFPMNIRAGRSLRGLLGGLDPLIGPLDASVNGFGVSPQVGRLDIIAEGVRVLFMLPTC